MARQRAIRHRRQPARRRLSRRLRGPALLAAVVLGAVAAVAGLIVLGMATQGSSGIERLEGISAAGRVLGDPNAPVTIVEFGDYQCPACKRFEETIGADLQEKYVATGQVRLEFRNMAIIGPESALAAEAAECANDQGKFWEYHDKLFEGQQGENRGAFSSERLVHFAREVGLDEAKFITCMENEQHKQMVLDETAAGDEVGVDSTPSFLINGELVRGVRSLEDFDRVIAEKLRELERPS